MNIGDIIVYNDLLLRVDREKAEYSCNGCTLRYLTDKGESGCVAKSIERAFANCKRDHIIFVCDDRDKEREFAEACRKRFKGM